MLQYPMVLQVVTEGTDQTAQSVPADLGLHCPHMPEDMFTHGPAQILSSVSSRTHYKGD